MLRTERVNILLEYLEKHISATVKQISKETYMSETTVRRDLKYLEESGTVKRSYGCAMLLKRVNKTVPFDVRRNEFREEKTKIASLAAAHIKPGDTVILDESSTSCGIVQFLEYGLDATIVTNSLIIAGQLAEKDIKCYCTGGLLYRNTLSFLGKFAETLPKEIYADKFFYSTAGISDDGIITDKMEETVEINKLFMSRAAKSIFLCDHSKFGKRFAFSLSSLNKTSLVITDCPPPEKLKKFYDAFEF